MYDAITFFDVKFEHLNLQGPFCELLSHTTSLYLMIFVTGSYKKITIRNPVTTVRQMCTDDVMHLYLADMMQHVLGAYCEI